MKTFILLSSLVFLYSCQAKPDIEKQRAQAKDEVYQTEKAFEKMAADSGLAAAFSFYVADSGIVSRQDTLLQGKESVRLFYESRKRPGVSLSWTPDFIDVSSSCDLAYTYGKFSFSMTDSTGKVNERKGFFHTVWKKQKDGSWRFVWD
jgi:ketosteroid isomerase-like protein